MDNANISIMPLGERAERSIVESEGQRLWLAKYERAMRADEEDVSERFDEPREETEGVSDWDRNQ